MSISGKSASYELDVTVAKPTYERFEIDVYQSVEMKSSAGNTTEEPRR